MGRRARGNNAAVSAGRLRGGPSSNGAGRSRSVWHRIGSTVVSGSPHYDVVVIGAGSAAFAAAIHGTEAGARVALLESNIVGGTCTNVGCITSKAMLAPAEQMYRAGHHPFLGIDRVTPTFDLGQMVDSKAALVDELRQEKYLDLVEIYGFSIHKGRAEFVDAETIDCGGELIRADKYIIATGGSPAIPPIRGL